MAVIRIKKPREPKQEEVALEGEPKLKRIRIKAKVNDEDGTPKPKLKINLKKKRDTIESKEKKNSLKLKLNLKKNEDTVKKVHKTPKLRLKPIRIPGEAYDSEASDIEDDPLIETGIVLRILPDIQLEFVKNSLESGDYSGISIKWKNERHAIVTINDVMYGAIVVDLPTVIEVNKSVDRKNLLKTFDVSQMLLCVRSIQNEEEVYTLEAPDTEDLVVKHFEEIEDEIWENKEAFVKGYNGAPLSDAEAKHLKQIALKNYDYKHGISPPLYNVRNRRFRRKMGPNEIDYVEKVIDMLLKQDKQAEEVSYDLVDESELQTKQERVSSWENFKEEPGEPSAGPQKKEERPTVPPATAGQQEEGEEEEEEDLDLGAAFESEEEEEEEEGNAADGNKRQQQEEVGDEVDQDTEGEDDEEEEDEEEEDEGDNEVAGGESESEEEKDENRQHTELLVDELNELETTLAHTRHKLGKATNPLLKSRFIDSIKKLEKEAEMKRKQLQLTEESSQKQHQQPSDTEVPHNEEEDEEEDEEEEEEDEAEEEEDEEDENENEEEDENDEGEHAQEGKITGDVGEAPAEETHELDQNDLDMMMLFGAEGDE